MDVRYLLTLILTLILTLVLPTPFVMYDMICTPLPLVLRAKSSGADAVKIMASVLPVQDIDYLVKIAKALGLLCVVVVSSKVQLLDVLQGVPTLQVIPTFCSHLLLSLILIY